MTLGKHTKEAVDLRQLLYKVAGECKLGSRRVLNIGKQEADIWFGLELPQKMAGFRKLRDVVKSKGHCGWFGYQHEAGSGPQLAVWFYCRKEDKSRTEVWLRNHLPKPGKLFSSDDCLYWAVSAGKVPDDFSWFKRVFESLKDR